MVSFSHVGLSCLILTQADPQYYCPSVGRRCFHNKVFQGSLIALHTFYCRASNTSPCLQRRVPPSFGVLPCSFLLQSGLKPPCRLPSPAHSSNLCDTWLSRAHLFYSQLLTFLDRVSQGADLPQTSEMPSLEKRTGNLVNVNRTFKYSDMKIVYLVLMHATFFGM